MQLLPRATCLTLYNLCFDRVPSTSAEGLAQRNPKKAAPCDYFTTTAQLGYSGAKRR